VGKNRSLSTAVHILAALGVNDPTLVSSDDLAVGIKTNPGLIRRVLVKLSAHGLVESVKGKGGGNRLAKSPDKISMKDIYLAVIEGPLFGSFDKDPFKACFVSCNIGRVLTDVYDGLEDDLVKSMGKVKLSKIIRDLT
jgi:Rrf2 family protein